MAGLGQINFGSIGNGSGSNSTYNSSFNLGGLKGLVNNGMGMGTGSYASTSQPYERQLNPLLYGRAENNVEGLAQQAGSQAGNVLEAQRGINQREMASRGLANPTSPQDMLNTSLATAGAANQARQGALETNFNNLMGIEKLKQGEEAMGLSRWNDMRQQNANQAGTKTGGLSTRNKYSNGGSFIPAPSLNSAMGGGLNGGMTMRSQDVTSVLTGGAAYDRGGGFGDVNGGRSLSTSSLYSNQPYRFA
jgi:hypothetical protein